jgi:quercetin dioxygenase-like cupin family protein
MRRATLALTVTIALALGGFAMAQSAAVQRTTLQTLEFPAPLHTLTMRIEFPRGGLVARHTHPGAEMGYVVSGEAQVVIAGGAPKTLHAGDSFQVAPKTVHSVANSGTGPLVILSTYVVDPKEPLATPVSH